jgi:hypothetical protein
MRNRIISRNARGVKSVVPPLGVRVVVEYEHDGCRHKVDPEETLSRRRVCSSYIESAYPNRGIVR